MPVFSFGVKTIYVLFDLQKSTREITVIFAMVKQ